MALGVGEVNSLRHHPLTLEWERKFEEAVGVYMATFFAVSRVLDDGEYLPDCDVPSHTELDPLSST